METPVTEAELTPAPTDVQEPTATPEPKAEIKKDELKIHVINATTKAGYAGTVKTTLETAEYGTVSAGNAKGDYDEEGYFVLLHEENSYLVDALSEDSEWELEYIEGIETEDPKEAYDAVIVLAKE